MSPAVAYTNANGLPEFNGNCSHWDDIPVLGMHSYQGVTRDSYFMT